MKKLNHWLHRFQHPLQLLREKSRTSLLLLSLITLFYCKQISGYYCNYDVNEWFQYFVLVERVSMLFLLLSAFKYIQKLSWIVAELLLFFLAQDIIDRAFYNIKEINTNDYIAIALITTIALIKIYKKWKIKN